MFLHKQENRQQHLILNMTLQRCKHNYIININKWCTDNSESYTHSWSIQFVTQKSWNHSWKRKSFRHWKDAAHVKRKHSCKRLQSALLHIRRIILLKTTFIIEWVNWNDYKHWCIASIISRHNYERLSRILNNNKFNLHNKEHHKQIDMMWNQWRNEKLLRSFINTNSNKS